MTPWSGRADGLHASPVRRGAKRLVRAYGVATSSVRQLPDFLIIGAKRAGSTSLYRYLSQHPGVLPLFPSAQRLPLAENTKGVHYFDTGFLYGPAWYRSHFVTAAYRRRREGKAGGPVVTGEASPYYLHHPRAAERAARLLPQAKIIALLRDPVERAYSHYKERRRNGVEPFTFEHALRVEPIRLAGEEERLVADDRYYSFAHEHFSYLSQGLYEASLRRWLDLYPPDQVCIVCSEDLYADPQDTYDRVLAFLGLAPMPLGYARRWNPTAGDQLDPSTRAHLAAVVAPHNHRLCEYLGIDLGWDR